MDAVLKQKSDVIAPDTNPAASLSSLDVEVIDYFVEVSRFLGQPRSLAEIYGLLFISEQPLAMDGLMVRLRLSKGSTSQGLRFLRDLGAVKQVYVAGDRRVHYEAVAELRNLARRFLRKQIVPYLADGEARLGRIAAHLERLPGGRREHVKTRIAMLRSWSRNGRRVLPLLLKVLGDGGEKT
jgi:DNA-binding transcriptional regulator GbsR (MarR family)